MAIEALGFDPEDLGQMFESADLDLTRWGTVKIDYRSKMSSLDGVFAAGDIVRGASLVVWAVRDGRDAAAQIHDYIQQGLESESHADRRAVA
jgi:glutamate synthase (NADPH/NADH) small chain